LAWLSVAQRRREIGIRLALGADRFNVLAQVMKQGLMLTAFGIFLGIGGVAWRASRVDPSIMLRHE
jgi:ABC-type antimicrobial peptide transport system permease subunit